MRNHPPQIYQPIVYNLTTIFAALHHYLCRTSLQIHCTSPQFLLHPTKDPLDLITVFAAPHHNLCCTSPPVHLTTIFAAPHHRSTLTTIFAEPHHRSTFTTIFASPHHISTAPHHTSNFTATTNSSLAYRNPTPVQQKLVVLY